MDAGSPACRCLCRRTGKPAILCLPWRSSASPACLSGFGPTFRHWVIPAFPPRVAAQNAPQGQPRPKNTAMFLQGFQSVGAAGGLISAVVPDPGAESQPIGAHGKGQKMGQRTHADALCVFFKAVPRSSSSSEKGRLAVSFARPIKT